MSIWDDISRFLSGRNDSPPVDPRIMNPDIFGGSAHWTEEDYQNALNAQNNMTPEQRAANAVMGNTWVPRAPELNPGMANVNLQRQYFNPYVASLAQAAQGKGPSQAQDALREGTATNIATQFGSAATPSVGGAAQAALVANAQNNAGAAMQSGARQSAQLRAQEMTDARQQLGSALNQQQNVNLQAVGLGTEREKANQSANIGAGGINAQVGEQNRGGVLDMWGKFWSDIRAKEDIRPMYQYGNGSNGLMLSSGPGGSYVGTPGPAVFSSTLSGDGGSQYSRQSEVPVFDYKDFKTEPRAPAQPLAEQKKGFLGNLLSDERSKDHIRALEGALAESRRTADTIAGTGVQYPTMGREPPTARFADARVPVQLPDGRRGTVSAGDADLATASGSRAALGPVAPYEYRYKPQFAAAMGTDTTPRAGVMAQDLEQSPNPALRSAVIDTPMGKAIEPKRAISANLALSAGLDKRLRNIESGLQLPVRYPNLR